MRAKCCLIGIVVLFVMGILTGSGYAQIDPASILGLWLFDENDGNVAEDSSDHGRDGTLKGGVPPAWVEGHSGSALSFSGANYVDCGNPPEFNVKTFSIAFWVNIPATQGWKHIVSRGSHQGDNPGAVNWGVMMVDGAQIILYEAFDNLAWNGLRADTTTGEWHHVVATYDGIAMQLFHDGVLAGNGGGSMLLDETRPLMVGAQSNLGGPAQYFTGIVDEVGFFNVVLFPEDVTEIMTLGLAEAAGFTAVSSAGKLSTTWADIKKQ